LKSLKPHQIGIALAAGGSLLVSLDSLGFRLTDETAWNNAFWLGLFIALAMFIQVPIRTGRSLPKVARVSGWPVLVSGALQTVSTSFFILAIDATAVSDVVAIVAATPMLTALVAHFAIKEKTSTRTWLAIAAAIGGVAIIVSGSLGAGSIEGGLYAVVAISAFSINLTIWRQLPEMNRQVVIGIGGLLLALIAFYPADPFSVGTEAIFILAFLGFITGPVGRVSIATSTRYLPAAQVGLFVPVETLAATTWAWVFLNEVPTSTTIIGGMIVIAAVVFGVARQPNSEAVVSTQL
jgi:drug/metabolite transporter (DMT)-like permease